MATSVISRNGGFNSEDRDVSVGRGNEENGTFTGYPITRVGLICMGSAVLENLSGIARENFIPFIVPEGRRPRLETIVQIVYQLSNGTLRVTQGVLKQNGNVESKYAVTGPDAALVTNVKMIGAVWCM